MHAFLMSLRDALADCQRAQAEAEATLTPAMRQEYIMTRVHTVETWNAMLEKYPHNLAIETLAVCADFSVKVKMLEIHAHNLTTPPDLTLGKARPSFSGHGRK